MRLLCVALLALVLAGCTSESVTETSTTGPDGTKTTTRTETRTRNGVTTSRKTETVVSGGVTTKIVYEKKGEEWVKIE